MYTHKRKNAKKTRLGFFKGALTNSETPKDFLRLLSINTTLPTAVLCMLNTPLLPPGRLGRGFLSFAHGLGQPGWKMDGPGRVGPTDMWVHPTLDNHKKNNCRILRTIFYCDKAKEVIRCASCNERVAWIFSSQTVHSSPRYGIAEMHNRRQPPPYQAITPMSEWQKQPPTVLACQTTLQAMQW